MRGSIVKKAKGSYCVVLSSTDPTTGKRRQRWITVQGSKKDAEKRRTELLYQLDNNSYMEPSRTTVAQYLQHWADAHVWTHASPRTAESYAAELHRHIMPGLGNIKLSELQPQHIEAYYKHLRTDGRKDGRGGLSARTVYYHHAILRMALEHAVRTGLLSRNVAKLVPPARPERPQVSTIALEDIPRFLEAAQQSTYCALFVVGLGTGMRLSELMGLRWRNVDLRSGAVAVVETLHRTGNTWELRPPKSASSRRQIPLPLSLVDYMTSHRDEQARQHAMLGLVLTLDSFVFCQADGKPYDRHSVSRGFKRVVRAAKLPDDLHFHCLRHTQATLLLSGDIHPQVVSQRLGHASVAFTLSTYSHVMPSLQESAAQQLDGMLGNSVRKMLPEKSVRNPLEGFEDLRVGRVGFEPTTP
jgi:integrase